MDGAASGAPEIVLAITASETKKNASSPIAASTVATGARSLVGSAPTRTAANATTTTDIAGTDHPGAVSFGSVSQNSANAATLVAV
jgi:hypothetical protein